MGKLTFAQNGAIEVFELYASQAYTVFFANPVSPQDDQSRAGVIYRSYLGDFKAVRVISAFASIKKGEEGKGYNLGGLFYSDQDGPFIHKSRGYLHYVSHLRLGPNHRLSMGTLTGFVNVKFGGAGTNINASGTLFSTNLGTMIQHQLWYAGVSVQQVFNQDLRPLKGSIRFPMSYNLNGGLKLRINELWTFDTFTHIRMVPGNQYSVSANLAVLYTQFLFGSQFTYLSIGEDFGASSFAAIGGIKGFEYGRLSTDLLLSYKYHLASSRAPSNNQLEVSLLTHF